MRPDLSQLEKLAHRTTKLTGPHTHGNLARMQLQSHRNTHRSTHTPRVLAVVLNWCAEEDTAACVASLMADDSAGIDIMIVDNASADGSGPRLRDRFPQHQYLQTGANLGYAGGNQRAIDLALAAGYEFVLIINDDAEVVRGCVGQLVRAMDEAPTAAAAAPTIVHHGTRTVWFAGGTLTEFKAMGFHQYAGQPVAQVQREPAVRAVSFLTGCVLLLRASAVRQCGGFREEFFAYVEDLELSLRFSRRGWRLLHVRDAEASHKVPLPAPADSAFAIRLRDLNRRRTVALHYALPMRLAFMAWFYPTRLIHLGRYWLTGDGARSAAIREGMLGPI
ncbi:MAG: glycosyltransferase family 2 protein [Gemmatimonas sp.]